jgi:hypothetical protein
LFAVIAAGGSLLVMLAAALCIDLYLHAKYERTASVNRWGYRGRVAPPKQASEFRVAVLGGSTAFGYGPDWEQSFPYLLQSQLNEKAGGRRPYSVVNLAYNNEGAYAFRYTLEDYESLDYDAAIMYEGYNDLGDEPNYRVWRHESAIFRATGYQPILPLILREKASVLGYGDVGAAYRPGTVFRATVAQRATAEALKAAAATAESLERQLGRLTRDVHSAVTPTTGCDDHWQHYCGAVYDAVRWARDRRVLVIVGTQPFISDRHIDQQNALVGMLNKHFGDDSGVVYLNLGAAVDLRDTALSYDGMHLNPAGNAIIANAFVEPVRRLTPARR